MEQRWWAVRRIRVRKQPIEKQRTARERTRRLPAHLGVLGTPARLVLVSDLRRQGTAALIKRMLQLAALEATLHKGRGSRWCLRVGSQ